MRVESASQGILGLCGFRCAGKSDVRNILSREFTFPVFDTDSVSTGDPDADKLTIEEVLKRYGKDESYFHFLHNHIERSIEEASEDVLVIDSMKVAADRRVLKEYFPNMKICLLWIHAPFIIRQARYQNRDLDTGRRTEDLSDHDDYLKKIGIMELCADADYVVSNVYDQSKLLSDLTAVVRAFRNSN